MARQTRTVLLLTIHVLCLSYVSFGEQITCWWNKVEAVRWNVYIECQTLPLIFMQKCPCDLHLLLEQTVQATLQHCTEVSVHFTIAVEPQAMQNVSGTLTCRGQDPAICTVKEGYPPPTCSIPLEDVDSNINCSWPHNPLNPMGFILYLEDTHGHGIDGSPLDMGSNNSVIIHRVKYTSTSCLKAWLSVSNTLGSVRSDEINFNTGLIGQPRPPRITGHISEPLEIIWNSEMPADLPAEWLCKVQYQKTCDTNWTEDRSSHEANFVLPYTVPFTTYTFRVRCWSTSQEETFVVMSDWSEEYNAKTPPAAPLGKLDVWSMCDPDLKAPTCKILWKEMPAAQAQGYVSGYVVRVSLRDDTGVTVRVKGTDYAAEETCTQCLPVTDGTGLASDVSPAPRTCEEEKSCFQYTLKYPIMEVQGVFVSASTAQGESSPSRVALPRSHKTDVPRVRPEVTGTGRALTVSWSVPEWFSESVQEYVVQHRPLNPPHILCLNWMKVNKTQNVVTMRVPLKVKDLQITEISSSSVNLTWTTIPFHESPDPSLHYLVGLDDRSVINVTRNVSSVQLCDLKPGQHYNVWISVVNEAGMGENTTAGFTKASDNRVFVVAVVALTLLLVIFIILTVKYVSSHLSSFKWLQGVPDPINSRLFRGMNNQVLVNNTQLHYPLHPANTLMDPGLSNGNVEIVMVSDSPADLEDDGKEIDGLLKVPEEEDEEEEEEQLEEDPGPGEDVGQQEPEHGGLERTNSAVLDRRKDYSQMIDCDDEQGSGEDEDWDEQPYPSDYERHFLPCLDV
ncbi:interleukin 12 receptor, beta 2a, like isoform X2 [Brachyhypopomus gauderio]|uniref:interleukin 12 receptor, beta 2a, like isoform X2 n=1 Tax=Brachyhypopomus gauderio TaxID=698409 RepID=UPI0040434A29